MSPSNEFEETPKIKSPVDESKLFDPDFILEYQEQVRVLDDFQATKEEITQATREFLLEPFDSQRREALDLAMDNHVSTFLSCVQQIHIHSPDNASRIEAITLIIVEEDIYRKQAFPEAITACTAHNGHVFDGDSVKEALAVAYDMFSEDITKLQEMLMIGFVNGVNEDLDHAQLPEHQPKKIDILYHHRDRGELPEAKSTLHKIGKSVLKIAVITANITSSYIFAQRFSKRTK